MLSGMGWVLYSVCLALLLYAGVVAAFFVAGRREDARAVAGFVPAASPEELVGRVREAAAPVVRAAQAVLEQVSEQVEGMRRAMQCRAGFLGQPYALATEAAAAKDTVDGAAQSATS